MYLAWLVKLSYCNRNLCVGDWSDASWPGLELVPGQNFEIFTIKFNILVAIVDGYILTIGKLANVRDIAFFDIFLRPYFKLPDAGCGGIYITRLFGYVTWCRHRRMIMLQLTCCVPASTTGSSFSHTTYTELPLSLHDPPQRTCCTGTPFHPHPDVKIHSRSINASNIKREVSGSAQYREDHRTLEIKTSNIEDETYSKLLQETKDILESLHEVSVPVAKLIPYINSLLFKLGSDAPNPLVQELLLLEQTKTLAANIYEAFSQIEDTEDPQFAP
ncbi:PEX3-like protein [Mya arenaria]|uniref:PEX3-like protein n=1 Tax=Mya arenaria TaxID=6604 RepID=A0ABY7FQM1_MYAAR|nr:PEX3-like protein [Mya arenaria]